MDQRQVWRAFGLASGIVAGVATRWVLIRVWAAVEGEEPPGNPAAPGTSWPEAVAWAVASGAALAVGRLVAQRGAAEVWKSATGAYPEGLEGDTRLTATEVSTRPPMRMRRAPDG